MYGQLKQDAPFTEERKQRILHGQPKRQKRLAYVPILAVVMLGVLLLFMLTRPQETPYTVASLPTDYEELLELLKANEVPLPLQEATDQQQVIVADQADLHGFFPQYFSYFPLIVEEQSSYRIGDYVMLKENGLYSAVQVIGVAWDVVETRQQQVYVNDQILALPGMMALDFDWASFEELSEVERKLGSYVESAMYPSNPFDTRSLTVNYQQIAVKESDQIVVKDLANVVGQVVGIQKIKSTLVLTEQEQAFYEALKEQGLDSLIGASPMNVAKIFIKTILEQEFDLNYDLTLLNENYDQWTREEHANSFTNVGFSKEQFQQMIAYIYNGVEDGFLSEYATGEMYLIFESPIMGRSTMKLRPNKDGIWQVGEVTGD